MESYSTTKAKEIISRATSDLQKDAAMKLVKLLSSCMDDSPGAIQKRSIEDFGEPTLLEIANCIRDIVNPPVKDVLGKKMGHEEIERDVHATFAADYRNAIVMLEANHEDAKSN